MSQTFRPGIQVAGLMRDSSFLDTYANQIRLSLSLSDVTLTFGVTEDFGPNQILNKDKAAIRLSMTSAKALMLNLQASIEAYEKVVSQIPMTAVVKTALQDMKNGMEAALQQQLNPTMPDAATPPTAT